MQLPSAQFPLHSEKQGSRHQCEQVSYSPNATSIESEALRKHLSKHFPARQYGDFCGTSEVSYPSHIYFFIYLFLSERISIAESQNICFSSTIVLRLQSVPSDNKNYFSNVALTNTD